MWRSALQRSKLAALKYPRVAPGASAQLEVIWEREVSEAEAERERGFLQGI